MNLHELWIEQAAEKKRRADEYESRLEVERRKIRDRNEILNTMQEYIYGCIQASQSAEEAKRRIGNLLHERAKSIAGLYIDEDSGEAGRRYEVPVDLDLLVSLYPMHLSESWYGSFCRFVFVGRGEEGKLSLGARIKRFFTGG
jgi:hypothetical protein